MCRLADAGYTTIVYPYDVGVTVHSSEYILIKVKKEAFLQGWKYKSVLWKVPVKDKVGNDNIDNLLIDHPTPQDAIHNVYELASTENCEIFTFHTGVSHQVHNSESYLE